MACRPLCKWNSVEAAYSSRFTAPILVSMRSSRWCFRPHIKSMNREWRPASRGSGLDHTEHAVPRPKRSITSVVAVPSFVRHPTVQCGEAWR
jgi:hypothetical protein